MRAARGRHAPPPEVRLPLQRDRLLQAAAVEFAQSGYAGASSESISRRAGMSKATFYEHFANKEECILALFDRAAEVVAGSMAEAARGAGHRCVDCLGGGVEQRDDAVLLVGEVLVEGRLRHPGAAADRL